jgi:hypothetical protein
VGSNPTLSAISYCYHLLFSIFKKITPGTNPGGSRSNSGLLPVSRASKTMPGWPGKSRKSYLQFESPSLRQLDRSRIFSARDCWQLSPVLAAISDLSTGLLIGRGGSFFSEWLNSLWSSGLRGFSTVLKFECFERLMNSNEMGFCSASRTGKSIRFRNRHIEVRNLPPQPRGPGIRPHQPRKARNWRAFLHSGRSPGGAMGPEGRPNPESLRLTPAKFPFSGDNGQRLRSIATAGRALVEAVGDGSFQENPAPYRESV